MSRVVQRTLESTQLSLLVSTLHPVLSTRLEIRNSRGMCKDFSRGISKVPPCCFFFSCVDLGQS